MHRDACRCETISPVTQACAQHPPGKTTSWPFLGVCDDQRGLVWGVGRAVRAGAWGVGAVGAGAGCWVGVPGRSGGLVLSPWVLLAVGLGLTEPCRRLRTGGWDVFLAAVLCGLSAFLSGLPCCSSCPSTQVPLCEPRPHHHPGGEYRRTIHVRPSGASGGGLPSMGRGPGPQGLWTRLLLVPLFYCCGATGTSPRLGCNRMVAGRVVAWGRGSCDGPNSSRAGPMIGACCGRPRPG